MSGQWETTESGIVGNKRFFLSLKLNESFGIAFWVFGFSLARVQVAAGRRFGDRFGKTTPTRNRFFPLGGLLFADIQRYISTIVFVLSWDGWRSFRARWTLSNNENNTLRYFRRTE